MRTPTLDASMARDRWTRLSGAVAAALILPLLGCSDWRESVDRSQVSEAPLQQLFEAQKTIVDFEGHRVRIHPRARYQVSAYVVDISRSLLDDWDFISPVDWALIWGDMANPVVLRHFRFHVSNRYLSWRWRGDDGFQPPIRAKELIANHHLIPGSEMVRDVIDGVRVGDLVHLAGTLVDFEVLDDQGEVRHRSRTSLSRKDVGSGACEQLWVDSVRVGG